MTIVWLCSAAVASDGAVELSTDAYLALVGPRDPAPAPAPAPWARSRQVVLEAVERGVRFDARWQIETPSAGWIRWPVVGVGGRVDAASLNGRPLELSATPDGSVEWVARLDGPAELRVTGEVVGSLARGVELPLLGAAAGEVRSTGGTALRVEPVGGAGVRVTDGTVTPAGTLRVSAAPPTTPPPSRALVTGQSAVGLTVTDDVVRGAGRLRWEVLRGRVQAVEFEVAGIGDDLELRGSNVASWARSGDRVRVVLDAPERQAVQLALTWSAALPGLDEVRVPAPRLEPLGVLRAQRSLQLARDGDREVLPGALGWRPVASDTLPPLGVGLIDGTPTAAFVGSAPVAGELSLARFVPVAGPATLVDVASYRVALSAEGRQLTRAHYAVRNDRGDVLRVTLPPRHRLLSARVAGQQARVARDGDTLLVPLRRSVETVEGLIDFAVELVVLGEEARFARRDERALPLPVIDAPIAVSRAEITLPPGWSSRLKPGEAATVDAFSEGDGITYGLREGADVARADATFQRALDAWMRNDFDDAQGALDELRAQGARSDNIERLQSNLDLVAGAPRDDAEPVVESSMARRVKDQARARASSQLAEQVDQALEADALYEAGRYEEAEQAYGRALELGQVLERLEASEQRELAAKNDALGERMKKVSQARQKAAPEPAPVEEERPTRSARLRSFEDVAVGGALAPAPGPAGASNELPAPPPPPPPVSPAAAPPPPTETAYRVMEYPETDADMDVIEADEPPPYVSAPRPAVVATSGDVVLPALGEVVRYQHALLREGKAPTIHLRTRLPRGQR